MMITDGVGVLRIVGEVADAAGEQHADVGLPASKVRRRHRVADPRSQVGVGEWHVEDDHPGRIAQAADVTVVQERPAVIGPHRLVDPLAVEEAVIEDRHHGLALRGDAPVHVDRRRHAVAT